ncbi:isoleucine--tRNA ligase [Candidatus Curtissbacteria bacterium RIFOXYB12_FULL_40_6]|nr:MAG: isoleucine--tRNA ligase [Candidatus Curtissbacteria bacterium RIFOXYB12_FULL_40_6]
MEKTRKFKPVDPKQDFVAMEKKLLDYWYENGIIEKYLKRNNPPAGGFNKKFSFLDGPITANNPMGVHHAWGRTYKDLWQRFYNMQGYQGRFQNGFDEQGLWIEVEVEKELGFKNKKDIEKFGISKFIDLCKERVKKYSQMQTEQSKRLGYFMDWQNSYHTSSDENNYAIWNFLKVCRQKGYLYKGRDSVPWCPRCGTAISQHEILTEEYQEITHKAVYVKYRVKELKSQRVKGKLFLLVWTTTPWTLPSNVAIAVNPELEYGLWTIDGESVILAVQRARIIGINQKSQKKFKGSELVGLPYQGVFDELPALNGVEHRVIKDKDLVTAEEGTGLVHIAPGAGEEDFDLAQKENLPVIEAIDEVANYIDGFGDLTGQNAKDNPDLVIEKLKEKKALFKIENYQHRYPTCWRCKTELVWRVVNEWYIAMDRKSKDERLKTKDEMTLRQQMVDVAKEINWIPKFGLDRELDWLKNMHDWLISKKRYWGLALPIWECTKCPHFEVIGSKDELKQKAIEGWDEFEGKSPHRPQIDAVKIKCPKCGEVMSRVPDVGNVWLDAGIVPISTVPPSWYPADFITESFPGQFKNWFYSMIAMATVLKNSPPYKTVLGFATLLDEKGEEMHKSKGNAIEFNEAADKIGVDVMRWMYLRQNPVDNLLFGYHRADEVRRWFYLRLWNVYAFFVNYANTENWSPKASFQPLNVLDQWLLSRLKGNIKHIQEALGRYDAVDAIGNAEIFIIRDLSNWFVRRSRDRIGPTAENVQDKEDAYQALYIALSEYSKVLAPMVPFVSDEIYRNITGEPSVHLANWPDLEVLKSEPKIEEDMENAVKLASVIHAFRKMHEIKVRIPLVKITYQGPTQISSSVLEILKDEVNVKELVYEGILKGFEKEFAVSGNITHLKSAGNQVLAEGQAREIVRQIQQARKEAGCALDEQITVTLPSWPKDFEDLIKKETLAKAIIKGPELGIVRVKIDKSS